MALQQKQKRFAEEFAACGNMRKAYYAAGYKPKSDAVADTNACNLLKNPKVAEYLQEINKTIASTKILQSQHLQEFLSSIIKGEEKEQRTYVNSLGELETYEIVNQANQIRCVDVLAKIQGLTAAKVEVSGEVNNPMAGLTTEELKKLINDG